MTSGNKGLRIDGLAMNFGGVLVFENVSMEIPPGRVTACIGPNGAGKTTIINIVCGVLAPKAGSVYLDDARLTGVRPFDTVRHGLCRSFQDVRIFPFLTAIENVLVAMPDQCGEGIGGLFLPRSRREERANRERARRLLQAVALESAAERPAGELPFAQQKLISLLRAVATGARVLLLDEPAAGVESELVARVVELIGGLVKAEGRATLLVEHNIDLVRQVADEVCVLHGGSIIAAGEVGRVLNDETVIREYLGQLYDA
ncbi:MAG TPA: ATP-binding cassette domain-containing protein [Xanthobacteraceae bacterium]|jgi:ABC-type branched-subunit amino acid transport system ATPase component